MSNLNHLENIYRFYWEFLTKDQINKLEKIRDIKWTVYAFVGSSISYYCLSIQSSIVGQNYHSDKVFFFIVWALFSIAPYLYAAFWIIKNQSLRKRYKFLKIFISYSFDSIFILHMDEYKDLIEFLNMLFNNVTPKEKIEKIQSTFKTIIDSRNEKKQLKMGYINSKLVSHEEFSKYKSSQRPNIKRKDDFKLTEESINLMQAFQIEKAEVFLLHYFNRKEKSFKGYYLEHLNFNGEQDIGFFWFSLIIPFNSEWSLDSVKTILNSCRLKIGYKNYKKDGLSIISHEKNLVEKDLIAIFIHKERIRNAFVNYKEDSFKKLFIKNHSRDELIRSLYLISKLDGVIIPVVRSWFEIHHFLDNYSKIYKLPNFSDSLESLIHSHFIYSYVKSYQELGDMAGFLQNCLIARHEKIVSNISQIIKITKDGTIYAAIEISNGRLVEISGLKNQKIKEQADIIKSLKKINIINR